MHCVVLGGKEAAEMGTNVSENDDGDFSIFFKHAIAGLRIGIRCLPHTSKKCFLVVSLFPLGKECG